MQSKIERMPQWIPKLIERCSFTDITDGPCVVFYNNTLYEAQTTDACVFHIILLLYENAPLPEKRPAFRNGTRLVDEGDWADDKNSYECLNEMMLYTDGSCGLAYVDARFFITLYFLDDEDDMRSLERVVPCFDIDYCESEEVPKVKVTKEDILMKYASSLISLHKEA